MPTQDEINEQANRMRQLMTENQSLPESADEPEILASMINVLRLLRAGKPEARSERARRYAVTITEMEKVFGYFKTFVNDYIDPA